MSRHFNYELDERRIKILLQEASMSFSEDVWNEFLSKTKPIEKVNKLPNFKINFAVNRSVLLTGVFILLIGSFTFVIARFVDFSDTKSNTQTVREVKPEPDNYKLEKVAAALPKKEEAKPTPTIAEVTSTMSSVMPNTSTLAASTPTYSFAANQTNTYTNSQPANTGNANTYMARSNPDTAISNAANKDSSLTQTPNANQYRFRKKKRKEAETLETKPLTQELPTSANQEPELELK